MMELEMGGPVAPWPLPRAFPKNVMDMLPALQTKH